ncbi:MAG: hypothetical protein A2049_00325 [Elusimicrobia bacterium GWA2_62_23]|nr:MAG: hypothetical protein A2049_00325 [Elusimicrobia bacterium GWA2_62_23]
MKHDELLKKAGELGFKLFEPEGGAEAARTLLEVARSGDARLMEGFPVMLAAAAAGAGAHLRELRNRLVRGGGASLKELVLLSLAAYHEAGVWPEWAGDLAEEFSSAELKRRLDLLRRGEGVKVGHAVLRPEKLKTNFFSYYRQAEESVRAVAAEREDMGLAYAMAQVFTARQKELFLKRLRQGKFTKTEKEYYSRVVKKKAQALANEELHRLARRALE